MSDKKQPPPGGSSASSPEKKEVEEEDDKGEDQPLVDDEWEEILGGRHHHSHHGRPRKYSLQEEPQWRREGRRVSIQPEDAALAEVDLEDLDSHRSDDPRALRRSKIQKPTMVNINRQQGNGNLHNLISPSALKKLYDHSPHNMFVQLNELTDSGEDRVWQETGRWIKYEEQVMPGAGRWGKPQVSSLSFHSLLNLRRCLTSGVLLLDLDEKDLAGVAYRITEQMYLEDLIKEDDKATVMRTLLMKHKPVDENIRSLRSALKKHASYTSLQSMWMESGVGGRGRRSTLAGPLARCSICSTTLVSPSQRLCRRHSAQNTATPTAYVGEQDRARQASDTPAIEMNGSPKDGQVSITMKEETYVGASQEDIKKTNPESILKRIPEGSEATTVLVGHVEFLGQPTVSFVRLAHGIMMPSVTEVPIPVRFMFILMGPNDEELDYHEVGRSIATLMSNTSFNDTAYKAEARKDLLSGINCFLDDSIVLPPGNWSNQALLPFETLKATSNMIMRRKQEALEKKKLVENTVSSDGKASLIPTREEEEHPKLFRPDQLERTGYPFGGAFRDIKRRYPFYISDITDGLNGQCFAAAIFMFFAALSSAITFGGLFAEKTNNLIGISETLLSTCVAGILFALLAGQPLMVVGTTGPLLLFDQSVYSICQENGIDFLTIRLYMSMWLFVIAAIVGFFEGSVLVKKLTRFSEDIFSSLISLIFISEPVTKLISIYRAHPLLEHYGTLAIAGFASTVFDSGLAYMNKTEDAMMMDEPMVTNSTFRNFSDDPANLMESPVQEFTKTTNQPNTALFSTFLTLGTFSLAFYLRKFRNGKFLGRSVRRALGDFGVPISIVISVTVAYLVRQTYTEKLSVPEGLNPSDPSRGWLVSFTGSDDKPFPVPAAFAAIVPACMVYIIIFMETHIAELIVDKPERNLKKGSGFHMDIILISAINLFSGFIGAPWVCVATVRSVSHVSALTIMSQTHAPGDKPYIIEVKEQRLSALLVSILVGVSVAMAPLLRLVPLSVLFGIFLYMGISSLNGIQFFDRLQLFLMPVKHHPAVAYVRKVHWYKMHAYTVIQLLALILLWIVKDSKISLAFPFLLILMIPLREQLKYFFSPAELHALDGKEPEMELEDEPDFYEGAHVHA